MASSQIGSPLHGDEDNSSYEKEGSPLNDDIFDILFPASPDAEENEDKDYSHVELNEYQLEPEEEDKKQRNDTQSTNKKTKITANNTVCYNLESSKNESKDQSQTNNIRVGTYTENESKILKSTDTISNSKDNLECNYYYHSSNNNRKEMQPITEKEPVLPIDDDDLYFVFSDTSLSGDEDEKAAEKAFNKSNESVSEDGKMLEIKKDKKLEIKNESEYLNKGKGNAKLNISRNKKICSKEVEIEKNCLLKTKKSLKNKVDETEVKENDKNNKNNKVIPKKTQLSAQIDKLSHKKNDGLEDVSDNEEKIELKLQSRDILDDISDDEISDINNLNKKKNYVLQDAKDCKVQKKEWTNEDGNKKVRLENPAMRIDEPPQKKYDEIVIIGDERLPTLTSYKNVKIIREEGLELRNLKSFIKRCGLHHDISSNPLLRRMVVLCVGLNDIILKTVSRDCSNMRKGKDKAHKPCFLFRYASVKLDLVNQINSLVKEISDLLPESCDVIFYSLHLFDLDKINENLSLAHYRKYGHYAFLSESDVHNNQKVHYMIIKANDSFHGKGFLLRGIKCASEYQERYKVDFIAEAKKIMVFNIKKIQGTHLKPHGDKKSLQDKNIGKDDLRWVLNRMNKKEITDLRESLTSGTSRDSQAHKKGNCREGWHSPGRCISPEGWHPVDICRQKEKERRELDKRKNMKIINKKLIRMSCELSKEEKLRSSIKIDSEQREIYERTEHAEERLIKKKRFQQAKEKMERSSRTSRSKEEKLRSSVNVVADRDQREIHERTENSREREIRKMKIKQVKEKMERSSRTSRSSERSVPRNNEGCIKRRDSHKYEILKKESPTFFDRCPQKSRSSSSTKEQEYDSTTSHALRNLAEVHDRSCQMYIDNPNAHPDYNKEYYVFYEAKSQKIREIGGDPLDYDFLPEWKYFWEIRRQELFREAWLNMKNQCIKMVEEKKMAQEKKNTHRERIVEDRSKLSKSSKRKRSDEKKEPDYNNRRKTKEKCISPPIEKRQKYEKEKLSNFEGNLSALSDKSQLAALIDEELKGTNKSNYTLDTTRSSLHRTPNEGLQSSHKTTFDSRISMELASPFHEEKGMDNLGLEEVGESVMPFNLGKYVPESKECAEEAIMETSNSSVNVLEILMMLNKLGDKLGSLGVPIKILLEKASKEKMRNGSAINVFTDPDMTLFMQLIGNKLTIAIEDENNSAIEKVIFQEVKNRVDGLLKVVEETFVEGLNVQHIAEKSLGMESSEIIKCIKSGLEMSTSSTYSEAKLLKIYKAVKEKQFRYVESKPNINKRSESLEKKFPLQTAKNFHEKNVSPTEIPFNLPTRKKIHNSEKYDPFEEEYF